uniref:Helicase ATP-binding domain-containing protein n=1 Tax=Macrostomum lignano TaxID=282301 RepID=A0A1I8FGB7_9PLAT
TVLSAMLDEALRTGPISALVGPQTSHVVAKACSDRQSDKKRTRALVVCVTRVCMPAAAAACLCQQHNQVSNITNPKAAPKRQARPRASSSTTATGRTSPAAQDFAKPSARVYEDIGGGKRLEHTRAGKSYTMMGRPSEPEQQAGIHPAAVRREFCFLPAGRQLTEAGASSILDKCPTWRSYCEPVFADTAQSEETRPTPAVVRRSNPLLAGALR